MNTSKLSKKNLFLIYLVPLAIIGLAIILSVTSFLETHPALATGIIYDLTFTSPIIYFFLIRKKPIPKITVVTMFVIGFITAKIIIPTQHSFHLGLIETYFLPFLELFVLFIIITKVSHTVRAFKNNAKEDRDFYTILKKSSIETLHYPKLASLLASEISMFYYAFFVWKKPKYEANDFSNYKENGISAMFGAIIFILLVETFVVHILLERWNTIVAWVFSISTIYLVMQIFAHIKALRIRKSFITDKYLTLRYGIFAEITIPLFDIEKVELNSNDVEITDKKIESLALLKGFETHNVVLHFKKNQTIEKVYGFKKSCDVLLLHIDKKEEFRKAINMKINVSKS